MSKRCNEDTKDKSKSHKASGLHHLRANCPTPRGSLEEAFSARPRLPGQRLRFCRQQPHPAWSAATRPEGSLTLNIVRLSLKFKSHSLFSRYFQIGSAYRWVGRMGPTPPILQEQSVRGFWWRSNREKLPHWSVVSRPCTRLQLHHVSANLVKLQANFNRNLPRPQWAGLAPPLLSRIGMVGFLRGV